MDLCSRFYSNTSKGCSPFIAVEQLGVNTSIYIHIEDREALEKLRADLVQALGVVDAALAYAAKIEAAAPQAAPDFLNPGPEPREVPGL